MNKQVQLPLQQALDALVEAYNRVGDLEKLRKQATLPLIAPLITSLASCNSHHATHITSLLLRHSHCATLIAPLSLHHSHHTTHIAPLSLHHSHRATHIAPLSLHHSHCTTLIAPLSCRPPHIALLTSRRSLQIADLVMTVQTTRADNEKLRQMLREAQLERYLL